MIHYKTYCETIQCKVCRGRGKVESDFGRKLTQEYEEMRSAHPPLNPVDVILDEKRYRETSKFFLESLIPARLARGPGYRPYP